MKKNIVYLLLALFLLGCSPNNSAAQPQDGAQQEEPFPSVIATPLPDTGTVVGKIVSSDSAGAFAGISLYFGTVLPLTPGPGHLVNMDLANSPKATIRSDGRFLAENIPAGKYVLVLWTPHLSRYVPDPANAESELVVDVAAGQIIDLGTLLASALQ